MFSEQMTQKGSESININNVPTLDSLSVVIPTFNGKHLLEMCLPTVIAALDRSGMDYEVIIVDDGSNDGTVEFAATLPAQVKLVKLETNGGFGEAANTGFRRASYPFVFLLNNDITLELGFFERMLDYLASFSNVFAITFKLLNMDGLTLNAGARTARSVAGMLRSKPVEDSGEPCFTLCASGAASIIDREKFLALGGFDPIYRPGYHEDLDLSYRAWKRGWVTIFEPRCIGYHHGSATFKKVYASDYINRFRLRNTWFFTWKNVTDTFLILKHLVLLPPKLLIAILRRKWVLCLTFAEAIKVTPYLLKQHLADRRCQRFTDRQVLALCGCSLDLSILDVREARGGSGI